MAGFFDALTGIFGGGNKIRVVPLYSMRHDLMKWRESGHYPSYYELPPGISFDVKFWERVKEIHRHTTGDNRLSFSQENPRTQFVFHICNRAGHLPQTCPNEFIQDRELMVRPLVDQYRLCERRD